ncbi:MAG TPA: rod shape-determining protein MreC [Patescibacteria group bacterium]|nr:rod shape-determining protein MreC [Patescibacteria group bacterium]
MLYLRKSSRLIILTVVIVGLLFFLHFIGVLRPIENFAVWSSKSIFHSVYKASNFVSERFLDFKSKQDLIKENQELNQRINKLLKDKSSCLVAEDENEFLRQQLDFVQDREFDFEIARVIGKNTDKTQNVLIIDKGGKSGLEVGLPVLAEQGNMIGKIIKVRENSAFVLLLNDDLSRVAVKIENKSRTMGLMEGEFGLGMKIKLIPQIEEVKKEDLVVTSGLEAKVPGNLIIGSVHEVSSEPERLFKTASVKSQVDFSKIFLVNVIKNEIK